ncbi:Pentatricopeptide repeat-containing protein [Capsicum annuum]|uniref:Pentatricopeptide repeat-containing protein n=1 Tax=Capsicum annuum TaxID=4072 RepID=A0A2G2ZVB6_CAPAN|nr:Pentatricopeptide repeat-containing protein [Capsicum annuum]
MVDQLDCPIDLLKYNTTNKESFVAFNKEVDKEIHEGDRVAENGVEGGHFNEAPTTGAYVELENEVTTSDASSAGVVATSDHEDLFVEDDAEFESNLHEEDINLRAERRKYQRRKRRKRIPNDLTEVPIGEVGQDLRFEKTEIADKSLKGKVVGDESVYYSFDEYSVESDLEIELGRTDSRKVVYDNFAKQVVGQLGMVFEDVNEFRDVVTKYALQRDGKLEKYINESKKTTARRARGKILQNLMGNHVKEFRRIFDYRDEMLRSNPGFTCVLKVDGSDDSGSNKGQLLVVVAKDGNNQMLPIDWAVVQFSFPPLLKAASRGLALREGMEIHGLGCKLGFDDDPFVQTALLGMYANCGKIEDARLVFDKMSQRDIVTWDIMIDGYCQNGLFDDVLVLLEEMRSSNVEPDSRVFTTILSACGKTGNLAIGKVIHGLISDNNIIADSRLLSSLISMYAGCGCMDLAQNLYDKLSQKNLVVSTAMISWHSKVGQVEAARSIFDQMTDKDLVCWSAMISGYAESDQPQEALKLLDEMQASGVKPDQRIHLIVDKYRFREALPVNNALIDMYAKCGYLDGARGVFGRMRRKNVISWTSMISAYAIHGEADQALILFRQMKEPNWITFVAVLYACSHAGLVDEAQQIFSSMVNEYNITPKIEHYGCMVDLYGRANRLREVLELVETMPMAPNVVIWGSLMAACRIHGEFELGEFAAKRLLELDPEHDGAYVFLSNVYAKGKRWENVGEVRQLMKHKGIWKERGHSKIEMDNEIHEFLTADKSHKHADDIYGKLAEVVCKLKQVGYAPNTSVVLIDVDEHEKKDMVLLHSEKLALCYGLLRSNNGSTIHIIKNLRICEDCHNFMKLASKVFEREIVVRDRTRFHHYRDGSRSCKDDW